MRKWIYSDDMQAEKMWFEAVINNSLYLTSPRIRGTGVEKNISLTFQT